MKTRTLIPAIAAVGLAAVIGLTACSGSSDSGSTSGSSGGSGDIKIGLLLPESKTTRYESFDRPLFEDKVKSLCSDCQVVYANADQDASKQQQQAESMLTQGIKVMVLDPVDAKAAASIVSSATAQNVPVVSYDRLINAQNLAYYISFDNEKVGQLQGQALVDKLKKDGASGGILMVDGSPTDSNAAMFKKGAHSVIDGSGFSVLAEYDTPDWSPDKAQEWVAGQLTQFGGQLAGIYAANDGTAGGAVAALKANGMTVPPLTGQDAELSAIQRIVAGDQYMTVYKAIKPEAEKAAEVAVSLAQGQKVTGDTQVNGVPSTLLNPVVVTVDNVKDTVVKDGFYTVDQICTAEYAAACKTAGLQ